VTEVKLAAVARTEFGKGAARRIRRAHQVPAVLYGHGAAPLHITLPGHETMMALKHANALLTIQMDGTDHLAIVKDIQRDAVRSVIEHVDLLTVVKGEKVTVVVPIRVIGESAPGHHPPARDAVRAHRGRGDQPARQHPGLGRRPGGRRHPACR